MTAHVEHELGRLRRRTQKKREKPDRVKTTPAASAFNWRFPVVWMILFSRIVGLGKKASSDW